MEPSLDLPNQITKVDAPEPGLVAHSHSSSTRSTPRPHAMKHQVVGQKEDCRALASNTNYIYSYMISLLHDLESSVVNVAQKNCLLIILRTCWELPALMMFLPAVPTISPPPGVPCVSLAHAAIATTSEGPWSRFWSRYAARSSG